MKKQSEESPYLVWLGTMPKANKEHFLQKAFEQYMEAWRFEDSTKKMIELELQKRITKYFNRLEVSERIAEIASMIIEAPDEKQKENVLIRLVNKLVKELRECN